MPTLLWMFVATILLLSVSVGCAQAPAAGEFRPGARVVLDAHNCYPEHGEFHDRIDRALATGLPVAIELDVAWHQDSESGKAWSVLSHVRETQGDEPTLESYFFERVRPLVEKALAENDTKSWPILYLHFNFKTTEREHVQHVLETLMRYRDWLSSATRNADITEISAIQYRPILVITETDATERAVFHDAIPAGEPFYVFGSAPGEPYMPGGLNRETQFDRMVNTPVTEMLREPADNYRRWWNNSWAVVERGGASLAGDWTSQDEARLKALVEHAHGLGYMVRFYTLNGHPAEEGQGWTSGYNFGSLDAVRIRWRAAIEAGVDFIATDQYEHMGALMRERASR